MTYQEAINESLNRKWKIGTCSQGEQCWCRTITCDPPLMYEEVEGETHEFYPIGSGDVMTEVVEHIVSLHNKSYGGKNENT